MITALDALHRAIIAAQVASSDLTGIVGPRIYDRAPTASDGKPSVDFPYTTLGRFALVDIDGSCPVGVEIDVQVNGWSRAGGTGEAKQLAGALWACLTARFDVAGFRVVTVKGLGLDTLTGLDGATSEVKARVRYTLSPAA